MRRGRLLDKRDGVEDEEQEAMPPSLENLLYKAGSSTFEPQSVPGMSGHEYFLLSHQLAPYESDGPGDAQEWNLFDSYMNVGDDEESLYDRGSLSEMLQHWKRDVVFTAPCRTSSSLKVAVCRLCVPKEKFAKPWIFFRCLLYLLTTTSPTSEDKGKRNSVKRQSRPSSVCPSCRYQILEAHFGADELTSYLSYLRNDSQSPTFLL